MAWPIVETLKGLFKASNSDLAIDPNQRYGVAMHMFAPGSAIWTQKNFNGYVREGYKRCGIVYICINKISTAAAGIRWRLYTDESMKKEITSHPLLDLWKKPNPRMGGGAFVEQDWGMWHLTGNSYTWAYRPNPESPPLALWLLRPDRVKIVPSEDGSIANYIYGYGTSAARIFEPDDVMHSKFPDFEDDYYGMSPLEAAMFLVDSINEGQAWNVAMLQNSGKPAALITTKGLLTTPQRDQLRSELLRRYSGKRNAGMPLILEGDMQWQAMSLSPRELDWLQSAEMQTRGVAAIYDIAPELAGDAAGKTYANMAEARQALYMENVLPKMDRRRDHLNSWLVPMYPDLKKTGAFFTYDKSDIEALRAMYEAAEKMRVDRVTSVWTNGGCSLDEYREAVGFSPMPVGNGKVFFINKQLIPQDKLMELASASLPKEQPEQPQIIDAAPNQALPPGNQDQPLPNDQAENEAADESEEDGSEEEGKGFNFYEKGNRGVGHPNWRSIDAGTVDLSPDEHSRLRVRLPVVYAQKRDEVGARGTRDYRSYLMGRGQE